MVIFKTLESNVALVVCPWSCWATTESTIQVPVLETQAWDDLRTERGLAKLGAEKDVLLRETNLLHPACMRAASSAGLDLPAA